MNDKKPPQPVHIKKSDRPNRPTRDSGGMANDSWRPQPTTVSERVPDPGKPKKN